MSDPQSRKHLITINNPAEKGYTHEIIEEIFASMKVNYWCLVDEIGKAGTFHTHAFSFRKSPIRWSTILRHFPGAHIDIAHGSCRENREYIRKEGKWAETAKAETTIPGSFEEWGDMPNGQEEQQPGNADLIAAIEAGKSTSDIIRENPKFVFRSNDIAVLRETILSDRYMNEQREVHVTYLFGPTGCGKTRSIFMQFHAADICRITHYDASHGVRFDSYHGHPVLVFEEYYSQIPISTMLNYLDRYPLMLPARYADRVACFNTVFITSNLPLSAQYIDAQASKPEVWHAFVRRISSVIEFLPSGDTVDHSPDEYR